MSRLRIGLLGYGVWARKALARNIAKHMDIAWVVDPSAEARTAARQDGYTAVSVPNWDAVEAAAIATPIATHALIAEEALQHGKHVLCEKPLALSGREAQALADTASVRGCCLYTDFTWTHERFTLQAAGYVKQFGKPYWFRSVRTSWDERGLDPIADLLPHDLSILRLWTGQRVVEVSALSSQNVTSVSLRTCKDIVGTIHLSYREKVKNRDTEIGCEDGTLRLFVYPDGKPGGFAMHSEKIPYVPNDAPSPEPLDAMCAEFVRRVKMREPGNTAEAVEISRVIEAAHLSVAERRVVRL